MTHAGLGTRKVGDLGDTPAPLVLQSWVRATPWAAPCPSTRHGHQVTQRVRVPCLFSPLQRTSHLVLLFLTVPAKLFLSRHFLLCP